MMLLSENQVGQFGGVFWIIVLLKIPLLLFHIQLLKALHHSLIQDFTILLCIHLALNFYQYSHTIPAHTTPYHKVIPSSMLDSRGSSTIRWCFTSFLPHIHLSI